MLLLLEANSDSWGTSLVLPLGIQKHLFHRLSENAGDLESERQTGVVFARFKCVDRAASDSDLRRKLCLRPFLLRPQDTQPGLHRYRQEYRINPTLHKIIIRGGMPSHERG